MSPHAISAGGSPESDAWIPLAEVARSHGVRGEVRLKLYNPDSEVLLDQEEVLLRFPDGEEQEVSVDGARLAHGAILMKLHAVDDRDRADELRGVRVCVRRSDFPPLEDGEFYVCDLEGAEVRVRREDGSEERLGTVRELRTYPSVEVLVVTAADGGKDWEVPLVAAFVERVDVGKREVLIASIDGLERG